MKERVPEISSHQMDAVIRFLPVFQVPGFKPGYVPTDKGLAPDYVFSPDVEKFICTLERQGFVFPFDWGKWIKRNYKRLSLPAGLSTANLLTLCKLLTAHVRAERFCTGHFGAAIESGEIVAILRRLKEIRGNMVEFQLLTPHPDCYWVLDGRFMAGEYPGAIQEVEARRKIKRLEWAGLTLFLDLTEKDELKPYDRYLGGYRSKSCVIEHIRMPLHDLSIPMREKMLEILDAIDKALDYGHNVYLHCKGGVGRTGTVVGCYFVRHGLDGDEALAKVNRLFQTMEKSKRIPKSPETKAQARMILNWSESG